MSTDTIFMFAIVVYVLMAGGMLFTVLEFRRVSEKASGNKSERPPNTEQGAERG